MKHSMQNPDKSIILFLSAFFLSVHFSSFTFQLGLENISPLIRSQLQKQNLGLVTNQTGIDQRGRRNVEVLQSQGIKIRKIFTPEHGFKGTIGAEKAVGDSRDRKTGIPVVSLYKADGPKKITCQMLDGIDTLIFDMQDSGMRHYTYISILYKIMQVASRCNKQVIVLDRPNPLGALMEGPIVAPGLESFISIAPIPLRHGLTMGELAIYFNKHRLSKPIKLQVIPMRTYKRSDGLGWKLPMMLSPNLKTIHSLWGYSFLGLLGEMKPFDVLVGTPYAFTGIMLAADLNISSKVWDGVINILQKHGAKAWHYSYFNTRKKKQYHGVRFNIIDINRFRAFQTLLDLLYFFKKQGITPQAYGPAFDKAVGTKKFKQFMNGKISRQQFVDKVNRDLQLFNKQIQNLLLYQPQPKIMKLKKER